MENPTKLSFKIPKFAIFLITILISLAVFFYYTGNYVIVRFNEIGPVTKNMTVYYNGFKVGRVVDIEPDRDYKHTMVKISLSQRKMNLPKNTIVVLQQFPNGLMYLEFIYPSNPSIETIATGDVLQGITQDSLELFMKGQAYSGASDIVSEHVIKALNATDVANQKMMLFFETTTSVLEENRKSINDSMNNTAAMTKSLAEMAENLNQTSKKLNDSIDEKNLKDSTLNIKETTESIKNTAENIESTTASINKATQNIDETMKKIDETISNANATAANLNEMTSGLNKTLSKRFGGMRVILGTPIKPEKCKKETCK